MDDESDMAKLENGEFCVDREHMFNWMVNDLTGLYPEQFYTCIPKPLNLFEMNKELKELANPITIPDNLKEYS